MKTITIILCSFVFASSYGKTVPLLLGYNFTIKITTQTTKGAIKMAHCSMRVCLANQPFRKAIVVVRNILNAII